MDDRSLSWVHLLPAGASICPWNVPVEMIDLLGGRRDRSGDIWMGWEAARRDLPSLTRFRALVLVNPRDISPAELRSQGFTRVRSFAVVPGIDDARWFISLLPRRAALRAWDLYTPFHRRARLHKLVAKLLTRSGAIARAGDQIMLVQREDSSLEAMLMDAVNAGELSISIASGVPGPRRRLMMQLTTSEGAVLAYAKYTDRPRAVGLVRQEAQFLSYVAQLRLKTVIVPDLLYHSAHNDGYLMVSAPIDQRMRPSEISLTRRHIDVLYELAGHTGSKRTIDLLDQLRRRVAVLRGLISPSWHERVTRAIALIAATPGLGDLPATLAHGDFAPWNLRVDHRTGRLALFDWEQGQLDQFLLGDAFHFQTQVNILVRRRSAAASVATTVTAALRSPLVQDLKLSDAQVRALYAGYLVDASTRWFEDQRQPKKRLAADETAQTARGQMIDIHNASLDALIA